LYTTPGTGGFHKAKTLNLAVPTRRAKGVGKRDYGHTNRIKPAMFLQSRAGMKRPGDNCDKGGTGQAAEKGTQGFKSRIWTRPQGQRTCCNHLRTKRGHKGGERKKVKSYQNRCTNSEIRTGAAKTNRLESGTGGKDDDELDGRRSNEERQTRGNPNTRGTIEGGLRGR